MRKIVFYLAFAGMLFVLLMSYADAAENAAKKVLFSANEVEEDSKTKVITAKGDVLITRGTTTLKADEVVYDRKIDAVTAKGNVSITDEDGSVVFADNANLSDKMTKGYLNDVKMVMADESRLAAQRIKQTVSKNKYFLYAVYSPCDVCEANPDPLWQLKARRVIHDVENKNVYYRDAFLELKGVPIFYTPFLSHPDPTVKRRSGFLPPKMTSNNYLGSAIQIPYFWSISDYEDVIFSPIFSSDQDVIWGGKYRKMFYNGELDISGTTMQDKKNKNSRGSIFAKGRYELNNYWVAKMDVNYASDSSYLKDLTLPFRTDTWLTSNVAFERFEGKNYASIETYSYKLISYSLRNANMSEFERQDYGKPYILPLATYEHVGDPYSYGGYFKNTFNMASIYREDDETQVQRGTAINSFNLPYTSAFGEKYRLTASMKSDIYYVKDYLNQKDELFSGDVARVFPQVGLGWRLPFVKATESSRQIVEPIVVAVAAPKGNNKVDRIPNEDSMATQLDDTNVLDLDRYSGYDRNDTGSRVSYGFKWSSYGNIMGRTSAFIAQSYYFDDEESFSQSLGSTSKFSDYVGRIYASPHKYLDFNYRFRIDKDNYSLRYNEINARVGPDMFYTNFAFISTAGRQHTAQNNGLYFFDDYNDKKELYSSLSAKVSRYWRLTLYNRQDLTAKGSGSLEHGGDVAYEDECFGIVFNVHKYNSSDPDYGGGYEFSASFILKTLGGFGSN